MTQEQQPTDQTITNQLVASDRDSQEKPQQTQEEMLAAYIEQQQRMRCPGCGEGAQIF